MPDEPEAHGLLALMLMNDARRDARFAAGEIVLLHDQDRSLWDLDQLAGGRTGLDRHYLHAPRAELLRRLDRTEDVRAAYHRALELVHSEAERRLLERRLAELEAS